MVGEISGAAYFVGSLIPPEAVLRRRFGTSLYRIREAMNVLRKMGMVDSRPGIGTVVLSKTPMPLFVQSQQTLDGLVEAAQTTRLKVRSAGACTINKKLADELRLQLGSNWWLIDAVRFMRSSSEPIGALRVYVLPEFAGVSAQMDQWTGPVFQLIERLYGVRPASVEQDIDCCSLDAKTAAIFKVAVSTAALKVTRHWYDATGRLIECSVGVYPQGRSRYRSRLLL